MNCVDVASIMCEPLMPPVMTLCDTGMVSACMDDICVEGIDGSCIKGAGKEINGGGLEKFCAAPLLKQNGITQHQRMMHSASFHDIKNLSNKNIPPNCGTLATHLG